MISFLLHFKKTGIFLIALLINNIAYSTTFTAVNSGNWSNPATWGSSSPSFHPTVDVIIIPAGISVSMDSSVTLNGANSQLNILGTLSNATNNTLNIVSGTLAGTGTIDLSDLVFGTGAIFLFTGNLTISNLTNSAAALQAGANILINQSLTLTSGIFTVKSGGTLTAATNTTLIIAGGKLALNGGALALTSDYNVTYTNASATAGVELSGARLKNININVGALNIVTLLADLNVKGILTLNSGYLDLGGKNLIITGDVSATGSGSIKSSSSSDITLNSVTGLSGTLNFSGSTNVVRNFTMNIGYANQARIGGTLVVNDTLKLDSGTLNLNSATLIIGGNLITGTGTITSNSGSNLAINSAGSLTGALNFIGISSVLNNLTLNAGASGDSVRLSGTLAIHGNLNLTKGILALTNSNLTLGGDVTSTTNGSLTSTSTSNISIITASSLTGALNFNGTGSSINNLSINIATGVATISGHLVVTASLSLARGTLHLNDASVTLIGNIPSGGLANISSSGISNLVINTSNSLVGALNFSNASNTLNNLTINPGAGNSATLSGKVAVSGLLTLSSGTLNLNNANLTITGDVSSSGTGKLSSAGITNLTIKATGSLSGSLNFNSSANILSKLTMNSGTGNTAPITGTLSVTDSLNLSSGALVLNSTNLTIAGNVSSIGIGTISSTSGTNISINAAGSISGALRFTYGNNTVNNFSVNIGGNGSVKIASDLIIKGNLNMIIGKLDISNYKLKIPSPGSISGTGIGSYIITGDTGSLFLDLTAGGNSKAFPIGTPTLYMPATVTLDSSSASGTVDVGVAQKVYAKGRTGFDMTGVQHLVNATWFVNSNIVNNLKLDLKLEWESAAEINGFNRASSYISHFINNCWDRTTMVAATPSGSGMYFLTRNNITSLSPFAVFDPTTTNAIRDLSIDSKFSLYPNPASDYLTLVGTGTIVAPVNVLIINMKGQVVSSQTITNSHEKIAIGELEQGCYYIKIFNGEMEVTKKFVKVK